MALPDMSRDQLVEYILAAGENKARYLDSARTSTISSGGATDKYIVANRFPTKKPQKTATQKKTDASKVTIKNGVQVKSGAEDAAAVTEKVTPPKWLMVSPLGQAGLDALTAPRGEDERAKNPVQWAVDALGTGGYATARAVEGVGAAHAKYQPETQRLADEGDIVGAAANTARGAVEGGVNFLGGLARGTTEGLGARYDGQRPRTMGQNLEAVGSKKILTDALGEGPGTFAQGALGFTADVLTDPLSFATLGATGVAKGVTTGVREGSGVVGKTVGGVTGAAKGAAARRAELAAEAAQRRAARAARKDKNVPTIGSEAARAEQAQYRFDPENGFPAPDAAARIPDGGAAAALPTPDAAARIPDVERAPEAAPVSVLPNEAKPLVAPELAVARARNSELENLIPTITGKGTVPDAGALLAAATKAAPLTDDVISKIDDAVIEGAGRADVMKVIAEATKANPAAKEFFDRQIKLDGKAVTLREFFARPETYRFGGEGEATLSDGSFAKNSARWTQMMTMLRTQGTKPSTNAETLRTALTDLAPEAAVDPVEVMARLVRTPPEGRKQLLTEILTENAPGVTYKNVDEAIAGAVNGQVEAAQMRALLNTLGVKTKTLDPEKLQRALDGAGRASWDDIQRMLRTPEEVLDAHGIDEATVAASKEVDLPAEEAAAAAEFQRFTEAALAVDADRIGPLTRGSKKEGVNAVGDMVFRAVELFGSRTKNRDLTTAFDSHMMQAILRPGTEIIKNANFQKLSGEARAAYLTPRYLQGVESVENYARSVGAFPHFAAEGATPVYIGLSDVLRELPEELVSRALFMPERGRASYWAEDLTKFRYGFTAFSNLIGEAGANVVRQFLAGRMGDDVLAETKEMLLRLHKEAKNTAVKNDPDLSKALDDVAAALNDPATVGALTKLHQVNAPVAHAYQQAVVDHAITPIAETVQQAVIAGADRGTLMRLLDEGRREAEKLTRSINDTATFVTDEVARRLDNATVNGILGERGVLLNRIDSRMAAAAGADTPEKITARQANPGTKAPDEGAKQAAARRQEMEEALPGIRAEIEGAVARGEIDPDDLAAPEMMFAMLKEMSTSGRLGTRVGLAVKGGFGYHDLHTLAVSAESRSRQWDAEYKTAIGRNVTKWLREMSAETGRKVDYKADLQPALRSWWKTLATVDPRLRGQELVDDLVAGAGPRLPMTPGDAARAVQLKDMMDVLFEQGPHGLFVRSGLDSRDVHGILRGFGQGFESTGRYKDFVPDIDESLAFQGNIWRSFQFTEDTDPMAVLQAYSGAISVASVRPSIGAGMSAIFDHKALGISRADALRDDWRGLDPNAKGADIARFVDPESLFPPPLFKQITYLENFLHASKTFTGSNLKPAVDAYKTLLHVLKSSMTNWRLGHHVANLLGGSAAMMMNGINPLSQMRSVAVMRAGQQLRNVSEDALARVREHTPRHADGSEKSGAVVFVRGKKVQLTDEELWDYALKNEVAMTHTGARDIYDEPSVKFSRDRWNPLAAADTKIGEVAAIRDNFQRIAHFIHVLENGTYRSLDEAVMLAARRVHEFHPTIGTLSAAEQKYARLTFYFYSWVRQMTETVVRTALDRPGMVTMPLKFQYEMAQAQGFEPESFGQPMPSDAVLEEMGHPYPPWHITSMFGPTYESGPSPVDGGEGNLWGYSLSTPQMDTLQSIFGNITTAPDAGTADEKQGALSGAATLAQGIGQTIGGAITPIVRVPAEGLLGWQMGSFPPPDTEKERQEYFLRATGAPGALASMLPGWNDYFDPIRPASERKTETAQQNEADRVALDQASADGDDARRVLNWLLGVKLTKYVGDSW